MRRQRERDTQPELALRSTLHRQGLRYRVHLRPLAALRREADIVFTRARVAVFVHGCFWHGCPDHATWPATNAAFWRTKIERNHERDRETRSALEAESWAVIEVWEHEVTEVAAERVAAIVAARADARAGAP